MKLLRDIFNKRLDREFKSGDITIKELIEKVNKGAILIDVRSIQEYNEGHLNGAINIVDYELCAKLSKVLKNRKIPIVLYCQNGGRSRRVFERLKKQGYKNIFNLYGGLDFI